MAGDLVLIGSGGHAKSLSEAARATGWQILGHIAPEAGDPAWSGPWLGGDERLQDLVASGRALALATGFVDQPGALRRRWLWDHLCALGADLPVIAHPAAVISPSARIGAGVFIGPGAVIQAAVQLGGGAIVNSRALCEHDTVIGVNSHIASGAVLTGGVQLGEDVLIGAAAVLRQGLRVGSGALVGAGSVVLRDVAPGSMVTGNPARLRGGPRL